jgi:hypothetical protein
MVAPTAIPATAPVDRLELSLVEVSVGSEVGSSVDEVVALVGLAPLVCVCVPVVVDRVAHLSLIMIGMKLND